MFTSSIHIKILSTKEVINKTYARFNWYCKHHTVLWFWLFWGGQGERTKWPWGYLYQIINSFKNLFLTLCRIILWGGKLTSWHHFIIFMMMGGREKIHLPTWKKDPVQHLSWNFILKTRISKTIKKWISVSKLTPWPVPIDKICYICYRVIGIEQELLRFPTDQN